jgi:hypothetical protein
MLTINAKAIDGIFLDEILDPIPICCLDLCVLRVQIREWDRLIAQPAVRLALLVSPNNGAIGVILRLRGEFQREGRVNSNHLSRTLSLNMYLE